MAPSTPDGAGVSESASCKTAIVIPCYNEERRLDTTTLLAFARANPLVRFWLVDDGSTDGTRQLLQGLARTVPQAITVVALPRNLGKGEAVRAGLSAAVADWPDARYLGYWDADLATPLPAIHEMLDVFTRLPHIEMVVGARVKLLGRRIERKEVRHYLGRFFATAASVVLALPIYDTQCGAKLFRRSPSLSRVLEAPFRSRWVFDVELLARYGWEEARCGRELGDVIFEYPLTQWTDVAGSRLRPWHFATAATDLAAIWHRYRPGLRKRGRG